MGLGGGHEGWRCFSQRQRPWVLVALLRLGGGGALFCSRAHGPSPTTVLMGLNQGGAQHQDRERRGEGMGKDV
jgi:hypothetical protein